MSIQKNLTIGLFGFGVVGEGIYQVLKETESLNASVKKICIKHKDKQRNADAKLFTTNYDELLNDPEINLIVELIDDADEAFTIVSTALRKNKNVVSANKKMIAEHLAELINLQKEYDVSFLYEAAVCGSIPILRNLEEYYNNDLLQSISGIVNGSTNYILTKMLEEGKPYEEALLQAQALGFAESNPVLDVSGADAANKLVILLLHAYGLIVNKEELLFKGVTEIHPVDARVAKERGYHIKLVAKAIRFSDDRVGGFVLPQFVNNESQLYSVKDEFNGIIIESKLADKQFLYGKGAGRYPTSSAVLSDISALRYDYKYEYRKAKLAGKDILTKEFFLRVFISADKRGCKQWDFEKIDEFYRTSDREYIIGVISFKKLFEAEWLRKESLSLIVMPDGLLENLDHENDRLRKTPLAVSYFVPR